MATMTKAQMAARIAELEAQAQPKAEPEPVKGIDLTPLAGETLLASGICGAHNKPSAVFEGGICGQGGFRHGSCTAENRTCGFKVYRYPGCFGCGQYVRKNGVKYEATIAKSERKAAKRKRKSRTRK